MTGDESTKTVQMWQIFAVVELSFVVLTCPHTATAVGRSTVELPKMDGLVVFQI